MNAWLALLTECAIKDHKMLSVIKNVLLSWRDKVLL